MKKLKPILLCSVLALSMMLSACTSEESAVGDATNTNINISSQSEASQEPSSEADVYSEQTEVVTINNFNQELKYDTVPQRVVTLSYGPTEIMVALGLEDKIVGIAEADNPIDIVGDEYEDIVSQLNVIAKTEDGGVPTLEVVLEQTPDFVYGSSYGFNADYGVGAVDDFLNNDINIYASMSTYKENSSIEDTYQEILDIGKIFQVEDKAEALVDEMKTDYETIVSAVANTEPVSVMLYNSGNDSPYVYFESSFLSNLATAAGATNALSGEGSAARITLEAVIESNPDYIVVTEDTWQSVDEKINYFKTQPELADITAIKEDNFVVVSVEYACFSNVHNVEAVEIMAKAFHPDSFE